MAKFRKGSKPKPTAEQMLNKFIAEVKKECMSRGYDDEKIELVLGIARDDWKAVEIKTKEKVVELTKNLPDASRKIVMNRAGKITESVRRKITKRVPEFIDEALQRVDEANAAGDVASALSKALDAVAADVEVADTGVEGEAK